MCILEKKEKLVNEFQGIIRWIKNLGKHGIVLVGMQKENGDEVNGFHTGFWNFPIAGSKIDVKLSDYVLKGEDGVALEVDGERSHFFKIESFSKIVF